MKKITGIALVVGAIFVVGYYAGLRPAGDVTIQTLSEDVADRAAALGTGAETWQDELQQARSRLLDGKAEIVNSKYQNARTNLEATLHHLQATARLQGTEAMQTLLSGIISQVSHMQQTLEDGREVSLEELAEVQKKLDSL